MKVFLFVAVATLLLLQEAFGQSGAPHQAMRRNGRIEFQGVASMGVGSSVDLGFPLVGGLLGYYRGPRSFIGVSVRTWSAVKSAEEKQEGSAVLMGAEEPEGITDSAYTPAVAYTVEWRGFFSNSGGGFVMLGLHRDTGETEVITTDARTRTIGETSYENTSFQMKLERPGLLIPYGGLGWNWVLQYGGIQWNESVRDRDLRWNGDTQSRISYGIHLERLFLPATATLKTTLTSQNPEVTEADLKKEANRFNQVALFSTFTVHFRFGIVF
ncbi:MAG: hypothetical protein HQK65_18560 [Desulfamplus sp.]|nr:hypothetical protein [Desulfamplus sp.]